MEGPMGTVFMGAIGLLCVARNEYYSSYLLLCWDAARWTTLRAWSDRMLLADGAWHTTVQRTLYPLLLLCKGRVPT